MDNMAIRCGIMSIYHKNYNYGGQYQAYAFCRVIKKLGFDAEEINYIRQNSFYLHKVKTVLAETRSVRWNYYGRYINRFLLKMGIHSSYTEQIIKKFDLFINNIPHSDVYTLENIKQANNHYDVFFSGSDQVWNPDDCSDEYFLNFVEDDKVRIAYSASIGREQFSIQEKERLKPLIEKYRRIGIRENEAKKLLDSFIDKESEVVLDPVMLLTVDEWRVFDKWDFLKREKYICVYLVSYEKKIMEETLYYSKIMGFKAVFVTDPRNVINQNPKGFWIPFIDGVGPEELIALFINAQYIFTNSYHGIALCINMKKDFWAYYSRPANDKKKLNSRINTILDNMHMRQRLIYPEKNYSKEFLLSPIDYLWTNRYLEEQREKCINFLKDELNKVDIQIN